MLLLFAFASTLDSVRPLSDSKRVRRMLRTIQKQNIERLRKMADTGFKLRDMASKILSSRDKDEAAVEEAVVPPQ